MFRQVLKCLFNLPDYWQKRPSEREVRVFGSYCCELPNECTYHLQRAKGVGEFVTTSRYYHQLTIRVSNVKHIAGDQTSVGGDEKILNNIGQRVFTGDMQRSIAEAVLEGDRSTARHEALDHFSLLRQHRQMQWSLWRKKKNSVEFSRPYLKWWSILPGKDSYTSRAPRWQALDSWW